MFCPEQLALLRISSLLHEVGLARCGWRLAGDHAVDVLERANGANKDATFEVSQGTRNVNRETRDIATAKCGGALADQNAGSFIKLREYSRKNQP